MFKIEITGTKAVITTPYNADFVKKIKLMGGRWDAGRRAWTVDADIVDDVRAAMREIYGQDDAPVTDVVNVELTVGEKLTEYGGPITMLGRTIASAWGRDSGAKTGDGVVFLEGHPFSGGSVKNWCTGISGGSVIKLVRVPRALVERNPELPDGVEMRVLPDRPAIDREALMAERERLLARISEIDKMMEEEE